MSFLNKAILFLIIFLLVFNVSGFLKSGLFKFSPQRAEAVWWSTLFQQLADYALKIWQWIREHWEDLMRDIIAKRIMDYIVDETVKWIQGGGDPQFVSDWDGFVKEAGDRVFEGFMEELNLTQLCEPFGLQVKLALLPVGRFGKQAQCTLDKVVDNINNFYVDFSQGGWAGYMAMWEPQNNVFGAVLMAHDELTSRKYAAQTAAVNEAVSGGGFLSSKKCEEVLVGYETDDYGDDVPIYEERCSIQTPGDTIGYAVGEAVTSDIQWSANIESWISALINAAINRLVRDGLASMKSSSESPSTYYPREYENLRRDAQRENNQTMINEINKFADKWRLLVCIKKEALFYAQQCNQSQVGRLDYEVRTLESKINYANYVISLINNAQTSQETAAAQNAYFQFMNTYNNEAELNAISDGSDCSNTCGFPAAYNDLSAQRNACGSSAPQWPGCSQ